MSLARRACPASPSPITQTPLAMLDRTPPLVNSESASPLSRRSFLGRLAAVGTAGFGASTLLAACGGDDAATEGAGGGPASPPVVDASTCEGYEAIDAGGLQTRRALNYVDATPTEGQYCDNCRFYQEPQGGSDCGGCQLFPGPVSPGGWCQSWVIEVT